jgi:hypothetical protein
MPSLSTPKTILILTSPLLLSPQSHIFSLTPFSPSPTQFGSKVGKKEPADPAYIPAALEGIDENDDGR